jgi:hypothetical protein
MATGQMPTAQGGVPPSDTLGGSNYLSDLYTKPQPGSILDQMQHNQTSGMPSGPLVPQLDYPADLPAGADAPIPVPDQGTGSPQEGGHWWDSILNGLAARNPNADPTQNAEIGPAKGGLDSLSDFPRWLHDTFGIGKGAPAGPPEPGVLDQLAGQMNAAANAGAAKKGKGGGGGGSGDVTSYGLGQYQEPPPAPHEAIPPAMDLSAVMDELRAAEPQRVPLNISKGTSILEGIAHGMASGAGRGFGTQLLAGAAGGLSGEVGYAHEQQRDEENFQRAMRDFHYRVAEGELHKAELGNEHNRLAAEIDYKNQSNDYARQVGIIEAHRPQAQMTNAGLVIQQVNPKTGQYEIKVDSRPIDHILQARMALKGMGASPAAVSSFTGLATGADGHKAGPADAGLRLGIDLLDRPDLWPEALGPNFKNFQGQIEAKLGKSTAYGTLAEQQKGKIGDALNTQTARSAVAQMLAAAIINDPETAKRTAGLLQMQLLPNLRDQKNPVVQSPFLGRQ